MYTFELQGEVDPNVEVACALPPGKDIVQVRVAAANVLGTGAAAIAVVPRAGRSRSSVGAPSAPIDIIARDTADGHVEVKWKNPLRDGGSPITSFIVRYV